MPTMVKFTNLLNGLFSKGNGGKLETDAVALPPRLPDGNSTVTTSEHKGSGNFPPMAAVSHGQIQDLVPSDASIVDTPVTQNFVQNVQNNTVSAPQTSFTNASGMQVYQIKNSAHIHIGNSFQFGAPAVSESEPATVSGSMKWANLKLSDTIRCMMRSGEELDTELMDTVSRHLGYEWKSFARSLEYSSGQIDAFEADHKTLTEQIFQFILDWSRNDDDPTVGRLVTLLWASKHKETVYYMKQIWKKRREPQTTATTVK